MRSEAAPYLIAEGSPATRLERISLGSQDVREGFLQQLLDENPGIVPVAEFDESFGPVVSLGREIMAIDNLFISPSGRLTVVETKLWRNPQAVREVLAQVVDYASRLAELDFETLQQRCRESGRSPVGAAGLFETVRSAFPELVPDEQDFVDRITRDLRNGRFLLLVVGVSEPPAQGRWGFAGAGCLPARLQ